MISTTWPTYHTAALSTDTLSKKYFGELGMLGYVPHVQREEIRKGMPFLFLSTGSAMRYSCIQVQSVLKAQK